jgi:hypothetical protein
MSLQLDLWDGGEAVLFPARRPLSITQAALRVEVGCPPASMHSDEAGRRLIQFCAWLQGHLDEPVRIKQLSNEERRIEVFQALAYRVEPQKREISVGRWLDGVWERIPFNFEVARPLATAFALDPVVDLLGLGDCRQGGDKVADGSEDPVKSWLTETAYRLLLRDPAFRQLRRETLLKEFGLPSDIYSIALACRARPKGPMLDAHTFNTVWNHERQFRQVSRENPRLLPLLMAFLCAGFTLSEDRDPIATLKSAIIGEGHTEAAWRYVAHHGSRLFKIPWAITNSQNPFEVALHYLSAIEFGGLPPPPPPSITTTFLHAFNEHQGKDAQVAANFHSPIGPVVLRAAMLEADKRRHDPNLSEFADQFLGVCEWSDASSVSIDLNQARAGWPWLVRQQQAAEMVETAIADARNATWKIRLARQVINGWDVVPLDSSAALIREALAMRNCLRNYVEQCRNGEVEIYSVRQPLTGKRKACIAFKFDAEGVPTPLGMKGFANTPPKGEFVEVQGELFRLLQMRIFGEPGGDAN